MAFSLDTLQEEILTYLDAEIAQSVVEQAIPDLATVPRNADRTIKAMVAVQFGDVQQGGARSMAGVRGDDYILPVYLQAIASKAHDARKISNKVTNVLLGETFSWAGTVRKRSGGVMFPLIGSNSATEGYMFPASFSIVLELANT